LLGNVIHQAFRRFVDDMLHMLLVILSSRPRSCNASPLLASRASLLRIIADLVWNATPSTDARQRAVRRRRSLALWSALFEVIPPAQGKDIESSSRYWPPTLRRRFATALEHRRRSRWPYDVYSASELSPAFRGSGSILMQLQAFGNHRFN
jgi:hypothetical protein